MRRRNGDGPEIESPACVFRGVASRRRKPTGFYWVTLVRVKGAPMIGPLVIAFWDALAGAWYFTGMSEPTPEENVNVEFGPLRYPFKRETGK